MIGRILRDTYAIVFDFVGCKRCCSMNEAMVSNIRKTTDQRLSGQISAVIRLRGRGRSARLSELGSSGGRLIGRHGLQVGDIFDLAIELTTGTAYASGVCMHTTDNAAGFQYFLISQSSADKLKAFVENGKG